MVSSPDRSALPGGSSPQYTFLGSGGKLGPAHRRHQRHEEESRDHQWQNDLRSHLLLAALHALCLQGPAQKLASVRLPLHQ
ncbi:hypothetical protein cypCar_00029122 [Cyprinus carpio]|nr:hypothetical protein cypCar_00029122 [Cyprinus carpio]